MPVTNSAEATLQQPLLMSVYRRMALIRAVDKAVQAGLMAGRFQFSYWPMTGQEAIPATLAELITPDDYMITTYRGIHDQLAKGVSLDDLFSEMLGRVTGVNKGKGGSPHISDPATGSMVTTAIVGAGAPIANGLAFAAKMRGQKRVTVVNFGDGATSIGAIHEAMNLAGVWRLPVIFLCQNNTMGEYTRYKDYTASPNLYGRAEALGFRGVQLDGNDPESFYAGMKDVVASVRNGDGPVFVEAMTMRLGAHAGVGDSPQHTKEELAAGKANWPVPKVRAQLIAQGLATEDELAAIEADCEARVAAALDKAVATPETPASEILTDVFADDDAVPRRGHYPMRAAEVLPTGETRAMIGLEAVRDAQRLAMERDDQVWILGEDVGDPHGGVFTTSRGLQTQFGARVQPTPIAEQAIVGAAIGSALVGMRPVAEIMFGDFIMVCMDQIANHAAKQRYMSGGKTHVPLTIRMLVSGGRGGHGAQHSQSLEAWLAHIPGLKIAVPSNPVDAKGLLASCIADEDPCIHMEPLFAMRGERMEVPVDYYTIPLGVAKVVRPGTDITLVTYGWQVLMCLEAAELLAGEGISCEVIDLRSLVPLDYHRVLDSVKKTRRALVVHAATEFCGIGAEIASTINEELWSTLKGPVQRFGAAWAPIGYSREIETNQFPTAPTIAARVREALKS